MIRNIRNRGLKRLYENDDARRVRLDHVDRLRDILADLDVATRPEDLDKPGYGLHRLTGDRKGEWSVFVSRNWRVTFWFDGEDAVDVNYEDYH